VAAALFTPFNGLHPMITLIPISLLLGIGMLWVFSHTSNQEAIRKVKARLQAHLYEMRLFTDEPILIWKAQLGLLAANAKYIGLMLVPALVASVPMILILAQLECFYGHAPIPVGQDAIVTAHLKDGAEASTPSLQAPPGIAVETPAVWIPEDREISWRVRAVGAANGDLELVFPSGSVSKSIRTGEGPQYVSERRVGSLMDLIWYPGESRLSRGPVDWIEINYPSASVHALGIDLHWLIWLLALSMLSGLIFKNRFRVSF
jgi:hypothetical protein